MAQHALFDNTRTQNQWIADAKFLRQITEHFASAAEQLDISADNGKAVFTSFTAKVSRGNGVLILNDDIHASIYLTKLIGFLRNSQTACSYVGSTRYKRLRGLYRRGQTPRGYNSERL